MGFKTGNGATCATNPPEFTSCFSPTLRKYVDGHLELSCTIKGSPLPQISWFYNDKPIDKSSSRIKFLDGNTKFIIRRLRIEDTGVYSCLLKNDSGETLRSCNLNVESSPLAINPVVLVQPDDITCCKGKDAVISCVTSSARPVGRAFVWLKNGQTVRESGTVTYEREVINSTTMKIKLLLSDVQFNDQGTYCLLSSNIYGHTVSKGAMLDVY